MSENNMPAVMMLWCCISCCARY